MPFSVSVIRTMCYDVLRIHIEALVHGNFTVSTALSLVDMVENSLINNLKSKPLPHSQQSRGRREAKLPDGKSLWKCTDDLWKAL